MNDPLNSLSRRSSRNLRSTRRPRTPRVGILFIFWRISDKKTPSPSSTSSSSACQTIRSTDQTLRATQVCLKQHCPTKLRAFDVATFNVKRCYFLTFTIRKTGSKNTDWRQGRTPLSISQMFQYCLISVVMRWC